MSVGGGGKAEDLARTMGLSAWSIWNLFHWWCWAGASTLNMFNVLDLLLNTNRMVSAACECLFAYYWCCVPRFMLTFLTCKENIWTISREMIWPLIMSVMFMSLCHERFLQHDESDALHADSSSVWVLHAGDGRTQKVLCNRGNIWWPVQRTKTWKSAPKTRHVGRALGLFCMNWLWRSITRQAQEWCEEDLTYCLHDLWEILCLRVWRHIE